MSLQTAFKSTRFIVFCIVVTVSIAMHLILRSDIDGSAITHEGFTKMKVAEVSDQRIRMQIIEDTSYTSNYINTHGTEINLKPINADSTEVALTVKYERLLDPAWYFDPLQHYATGLLGEYLIGVMIVSDEPKHPYLHKTAGTLIYRITVNSDFTTQITRKKDLITDPFSQSISPLQALGNHSTNPTRHLVQSPFATCPSGLISDIPDPPHALKTR